MTKDKDEGAELIKRFIGLNNTKHDALKVRIDGRTYIVLETTTQAGHFTVNFCPAQEAPAKKGGKNDSE